MSKEVCVGCGLTNKGNATPVKYRPDQKWRCDPCEHERCLKIEARIVDALTIVRASAQWPPALTDAALRERCLRAESVVAKLNDALAREPTMPSEGHDAADEVLGLMRVARDQRDAAWAREGQQGAVIRTLEDRLMIAESKRDALAAMLRRLLAAVGAVVYETIPGGSVIVKTPDTHAALADEVAHAEDFLRKTGV